MNIAIVNSAFIMMIIIKGLFCYFYAYFACYIHFKMSINILLKIGAMFLYSNDKLLYMHWYVYIYIYTSRAYAKSICCIVPKIEWSNVT